jgi:nitroreductase
MTVKDLVYKNRSFRRFHEDSRIALSDLRELVDLGRMSACSANQQPLKYIISNDSRKNDLIFPHLRWAKKLKNWLGPKEGERPSAYIIILGDRTISDNFGQDHGIAAQSIMLGAAEKGFGGCMIANIDRRALRQALAVEERYEILLVLALGLPAETVVVDDLAPDGNTDYWRDENGVHHVPKRRLEDIIVEHYCD